MKLKVLLAIAVLLGYTSGVSI
jgi:Histidine phosphatase superfamily (branch 2)